MPIRVIEGWIPEDQAASAQFVKPMLHSAAKRKEQEADMKDVLKMRWTTEGQHPYLIAEVGPGGTKVMIDSPDSGGGSFHPAWSTEDWGKIKRLITKAPELYDKLLEAVERAISQREASDRYATFSFRDVEGWAELIKEIRDDKKLPGLDPNEIGWYLCGNKIHAIKLYKERTECSLKEAKEAVDAFADSLPGQMTTREIKGAYDRGQR